MVSRDSQLLGSLLQSDDAARQERAWEQFVQEHSRLILHAIRQKAGTHDAVMDRYAFVLEQLRADDFARLRRWGGHGECKLTTWLVVVVHRLCTDFVRRQYGRTRAAGAAALEERQRRRRLTDFVMEELQDDASAPAPDGQQEWFPVEADVRRAELAEALARAVHGLPPEDQLLLTLRFRDGLSAARIARLMALPTPFHVYRRLNHLFSSMREVLQRQGIEDSVP